MKQKEVEQRVRVAVEHAAPDKADEILTACGQPAGSGADARSGAKEKERSYYTFLRCGGRSCPRICIGLADRRLPRE